MKVKTHTILLIDNTNKGKLLDNFTVAMNKLPTEQKPNVAIVGNTHLEHLEYATTYPHKSEFIIINADSFDNVSQLVAIADKNNYEIILVNEESTDLDVDFVDWIEYTQRLISDEWEWITIGDVHGCFNEMMILLTDHYGFDYDELDMRLLDTPKSKKYGLIFLGDLIDKSSDEDLELTLRFIHKNMTLMGDRMHLIMGNHEEMVWKWITNDPSLEITPTRIEQKGKYYNTTFLLEKNSELKEIFLEIYSAMKGWVKTKDFIVTHAPCEIKYLEKIDSESLKKQYKCASRSKNRDKTNDEITPYLMLEANETHPKHIFGHMGQTNVREFKNKICIDTGCVYGGELTGYNHSNGEIKIVKSLSSKEARNDFSNNLFNLDNK